MKKLSLLFIFILLLSGCAQPKTEQTQEETYQPNPGAECQVNSDCKTPMEYMVQSNCPFGSACIENTCRVVCPLFYHDPNPEVSKSYSFSCKENSDCDCSDRGTRTLECRCVEGGCLSIEG